MNLTIDTSKLDNNIDVENLKSKGDMALDFLWKTPWIKMTLTKEDVDQVGEITLLANKIRAVSDIAVVVADGLMAKSIRAMVTANKEEENQTQVVVFGNTLSALDFAELMETLEGKNYSVIAISAEEETVEFKAAFSCLRKMLIEKYGPEGAGQRMHTILGDKKSYMEEESSQDDISVLSLPKGIENNCYGNTVGLLLPMAVAGIDIDSYLEGFSDMVADPAWDIDGTKLALALTLEASKGPQSESVFAPQRELSAISSWISAILQSKAINSDTKIWLITEKETTDIALPSFPGCSEDGSLNVLLKEQFDQRFDQAADSHKPVKIQLPDLSPYTMGQLNALVEITFEITSFILKN